MTMKHVSSLAIASQCLAGRHRPAVLLGASTSGKIAINRTNEVRITKSNYQKLAP